jgi:hypothetical protein
VRENDRPGPNVGTDTSLPDWVRSPFSVFTDPAASACDTPPAAGLEVPPAVAPAGTSPSADGARPCVLVVSGPPSRMYGWPAAPSEAVKSWVASPAML